MQRDGRFERIQISEVFAPRLGFPPRLGKFSVRDLGRPLGLRRSSAQALIQKAALFPPLHSLRTRPNMPLADSDIPSSKLFDLINDGIGKVQLDLLLASPPSAAASSLTPFLRPCCLSEHR